MSYLKPVEFVQSMIDAGETKLFMSTRDTFLRAMMAGAILAIAVALAVTAAVQTGLPIVGALLFPVGFCILILMGFDLLTGVFALVPLALIDKRKGVTLGGVLRNWMWVGLGNLTGSLIIAALVAIVWTYGFQAEPGAVGHAIAKISSAKTLSYVHYGLYGTLTAFIKGILCNWMVCLGVVGSMLSKSVSGKVIAMWMPITIFFGLAFEHAVVNMFILPLGMMMGAEFTISDAFIWNLIPVTLGNLVGGLGFTGLVLYITHAKTAPTRKIA